MKKLLFLFLIFGLPFARADEDTPTPTATATSTSTPTATATATPTATATGTPVPTSTPVSVLWVPDTLGQGKALKQTMSSEDNGVTGHDESGAKFSLNNNYHMVKVASLDNVGSLSGEQTIDGYGTGTGGGNTTVLLPNQTTQTEKGPWITSSGAWTRPSWWANGSTPPKNSAFFVQTGDTFAGVTYFLNTSNVVVGTTDPQIWSRTEANAGNFQGELTNAFVPWANVTGDRPNIIGEAHFDGSDPVHSASVSGNISGVSALSTGKYSITFTVPVSDTNYGATITIGSHNGTAWSGTLETHDSSTTDAVVETREYTGGLVATFDLSAPASLTVVIYKNP